MSMWSARTAKYKEQIANGRATSVTLELIEDGVTIHSRTITEQEYKRSQYHLFISSYLYNDLLIHSIVANVSSSASRVVKVFMLGNNQEHESDIARAFDILDQGKRGLYSRKINLSDGLISPDELRAFLSILTDEVIFNLIKVEFIYL